MKKHIIKNEKAQENSKDFLNRDIIANKKLEEHIITMIKYMKLPKIKNLLQLFQCRCIKKEIENEAIIK